MKFNEIQSYSFENLRKFSKKRPQNLIEVHRQDYCRLIESDEARAIQKMITNCDRRLPKRIATRRKPLYSTFEVSSSVRWIHRLHAMKPPICF